MTYLKTQLVCLAAVKENGWALEYVREQTSEICEAAVRQNWIAIRYIKDEGVKQLFLKALGLA